RRRKGDQINEALRQRPVAVADKEFSGETRQLCWRFRLCYRDAEVGAAPLRLGAATLDLEDSSDGQDCEGVRGGNPSKRCDRGGTVHLGFTAG
ncbi:MAG: hypothetical protein ACYDC1_10095, partial [Limisphaerales bacterium]